MDLLAIILIIVGVGLMIAEIFIPSFGMTGILGLVAILSGVLLTANSIAEGVIMFLIIFIIVLILMFIAYRFIASKRSPLILKDSVRVPQPKSDLNYFLGMEGVALSILRPSGKADFDGVRLDVISSGEFVKKGSKIIVTSVEGEKIIVEEKMEGELNG